MLAFCVLAHSFGGPCSLRSLRAPLGTALGEGKHRLSLPLVGGIYQTLTMNMPQLNHINDVTTMDPG